MEDENSIVTVRCFLISEEDYKTLVNFCKDHGIENIPLRKNIFLETCVVDGIAEEPQPQNDASLYVADLRIVQSEMSEGKPGNILSVVGTCPELLEVSKGDVESIMKREDEDEDPYSLIDSDPLEGFNIGYYTEFSDLDLRKMTVVLREYFSGGVTFDTFRNRYAIGDDYFKFIVDGMEPDDEKRPRR